MFSNRHLLRHPLRLATKKVFGCCLLLLLTVATHGYSRPTDAELSLAISKYLECLPLATMHPDKNLPTFATKKLCLTAIYNTTEVAPLWVTGEGPTEKAKIILSYLSNSYQHGLNPKEYNVDGLQKLWQTENVDKLAELDTALTYNLAKYIYDISYNQLKPSESDPALYGEAGGTDFPPVSGVKQALSTKISAPTLPVCRPSTINILVSRQALSIIEKLRRTAAGRPSRLAQACDREK